MFKLFINILCALTFHSEPSDLEKAQITLNAIYHNYSSDGTDLLKENYPYDTEYEVSYLGGNNVKSKNKYSYLWPYSGMFSATNAIYECTKNKEYKNLLDNKVLNGLEEYFDDKRKPSAYSSYINSAQMSDRFYDDNIWIAIDFVDIYSMTSEIKYLDKAQLIWQFLMSGTDNKLGGGMYWCEQKKESKNTCSNAPAAVLGAKLYMATNDIAYLDKSIELYSWTKNNLEDKKDHLYFDKMSLDKKTDKRKFAYNSGQMIQAGALLYTITGDTEYLEQAQATAAACYGYFFEDFTAPDGTQVRILKPGNTWFHAVMVRGLAELCRIDGNHLYMDAVRASADTAWKYSRTEEGLFNDDMSGRKQDDRHWLLTQWAMTEIHARLATFSSGTGF